MSDHYDYDDYEKDSYRQSKKDDNDALSWVFIAFMFVIWWPLGLFFLIKKLGESSDKKTYTKTRTKSSTKTTAKTAAKPTAAKKVTRSPNDTNKTARVLKIVGGILAALGGIACLGVLSELGYYINSGELWWFFEELFPCLGILAGGIAMLNGGQRMTRRMRRFAKYLAAAGSRTVVPISYLADAAQVSERRVERDLDIMIERGMWGKDAYVDLGAGKLFRSQAAAATFYDQQGEAASFYYNREEKKAEMPPQALQGYSGVLRQLRRANDRIADEALSAKIDRLEAIAGRIFRIIEEEPEKKAKANTFLNYYIPTTQKLLDSYAEFEEAGINGGNLTEAKRKIERIMDNIVRGFEHQLDELYRADALDIDSDIRVMETMLRRDSSSAEKDFGLGGGTATAVQGEDTIE